MTIGVTLRRASPWNFRLHPMNNGEPAAQDPMRLLLAEDHGLVREGIRSVLSAYPTITIVGEASNGLEAVRLCLSLRPDVVVMDINMPELGGIEATRLIKAKYPAIVVIGLSVYARGESEKAMKRAGAYAVVPKEEAVEDLYSVICEAIKSASDGGTGQPAS